LPDQSRDNPETLFPRRVFTVSDFELSNGVLKFFNLQGLFKKKVVVVREIPVSEIGNVESYWNELSVTWNGVTNIFFKKNSFESLSDLRDKIQSLIEENQTDLRKRQNADLRQTELVVLINGVAPVIDICFDVLMLLHGKRPDWPKINQISVNMLQDLTLTGQTLPLLSLDFSSFSRAVATQLPEVVSTEAYSLLWAIHDYFWNLPQGDKADEPLDFKPVLTVIDSYYAINDIFLGKVVGDQDNKKETQFLESSLIGLSEIFCLKVDIEVLKDNFSKFDLANDKAEVVSNTRRIFKEKLVNLVVKPQNSQFLKSPSVRLRI
jgi:hypothetical protein